MKYCIYKTYFICYVLKEILFGNTLIHFLAELDEQIDFMFTSAC